MRRKPFLWLRDPDPITRGMFWFWIIAVSTISVGMIALGSMGIIIGIYTGGFFFLFLGIFVGFICYWGARDDWTLDEREAI
jgi:hypothetical protein